MNKPRLPTGFTLIEILIVISIGSVVMTIAAARYNQLTQRKRIEQQTKDTVTFLRKIKKMADSGEKVNCPGIILGHVIENIGATDQLRSVAVCDPYATPPGDSQRSSTELRLENHKGAEVQASQQFSFLPLSKGADIGATPVRIWICPESPLACNATRMRRTIEIDSGGNINEL